MLKDFCVTLRERELENTIARESQNGRQDGRRVPRTPGRCARIRGTSKSRGQTHAARRQFPEGRENVNTSRKSEKRTLITRTHTLTQ